MKNTCPDISPITNLECKDVTFKQHKQLYFNPETKEVKDELGNIIGTGEVIHGILNVTRNKIN